MNHLEFNPIILLKKIRTDKQYIHQSSSVGASKRPTVTQLKEIFSFTKSACQSLSIGLPVCAACVALSSTVVSLLKVTTE